MKRRYRLAALAASLVPLAIAGCDDAPSPSPDASVSESSPAPATPAPVRGARQQTAIVDAQGFGQPIEAATLELPAGWTSEGGVGWQRDVACAGNQMRLNWVARSPDGQQALELMHPFTWQLQGRSVPLNPCPVLPIASAREFLLAVVQQRRPGAQVVDYLDRPDLREQAQSQAAPGAPGARRHFDAGELRIVYPFNGGQVHERLTTSVSFSELQGTVQASAGIVHAQRRMDREPDPAVAEAIVASMKPNPQWLAQVREYGTRAAQQHASRQSQQIESWHAREMARINAQGMADRAAIRAQTQREISAMQAQTYANTQATNDRMHRRALEGIGEYNTYSDTSGNPVRSSIHGGSRVLQHRDGSFSSTNDPYYQPPGSTELRRVP